MTDLYGPPKIAVSSLNEISPAALEQLAQWIEQRGIRVPLSQIVGYQQLTPRQVQYVVVTPPAGTTNSLTFVDFPGAGNQFASVRAGGYLFFWSARVKMDVNTHTGCVGVQINGADPGGITGTGGSGGNLQFLFNNTDPVTQTGIFYARLTGEPQTVKLRWVVDSGTATVDEYVFGLTRIGT